MYLFGLFFIYKYTTFRNYIRYITLCIIVLHFLGLDFNYCCNNNYFDERYPPSYLARFLFRRMFAFKRKGGVNMTRTKDEIENIVNNLGYELLDEYMDKKHYRRVVIQDKDGYKYDVPLINLMATRGSINFIDKANIFVLYNISLWLELNNKDFELCEENIYVNNSNKLKFYHPACDEYFYMDWDYVQRNCNCPICAGRQVGIKTSLAYLRPELSKEFIKSEHNKIPEDITEFSMENVYWECFICNHKWWSTVANRTTGNGCPGCSGRDATDKNRLSIINSFASSEWHPTKNGDLTPNDVSYGSNKKVWWLCSKCFCEWNTTINSRNDTGCPKCAIEQKESFIATECKQYFYDNYGATPEYNLFKNPRTNHWLRCDIYIPNNIFVEIHGGQHYLNKSYFYKTQEDFEYRQYLDKIKKEYCQNNGLYIEVDLRKIKTTIDAIRYIENILREYFND